MRLTVSLHGAFRCGRFKEKEIEAAPGSSVQDVIDQLRLPPHILGIVLINDVHSSTEDLLADGDSLVLLPILDGG